MSLFFLYHEKFDSQKLCVSWLAVLHQKKKKWKLMAKKEIKFTFFSHILL